MSYIMMSVCHVPIYMQGHICILVHMYVGKGLPVPCCFVANEDDPAGFQMIDGWLWRYCRDQHVGTACMQKGSPTNCCFEVTTDFPLGVNILG